MLNKVGITVIGLIVGAATLFADNALPPANDANLYSGGGVTGVALTTLQTPVVQVGYYGDCWMFDVGASVLGSKNFDAHLTTILGHLGLRNRVYQNLFVSVGAMGLGGVTSKHLPNTWSVGAFIGLDYQLSKHFMISGKTYPYNYSRTGELIGNNIFANSTISFFYVY